MANDGNAKVLKARVEINTSAAEKKLKGLTDRINALNRAFSNNSKTNDALNNSIEKSNNASKKLKNTQDNVGRAMKNNVSISKLMVSYLRRNNNQSIKLRDIFEAINAKTRRLPSAMGRFTESIRKSNTEARKTESIFDRIYHSVRNLAAVYAGLTGARVAIEVADKMTSAQNRLNDVNAQALGEAGYTTDANGNKAFSNETLNATSTQMDKMYAASQRARVGYDDMLQNVSKSMVLAGSAFDDNMDNAIRFQEIMGKTYALGGASAAEMSSSMYQMIQALGAGTLAGDELRSVREGAPLAYQAIEKYAQGVHNSTDSLKDMASQGLITSDIVVAAMLQAGDTIDDRFAMTSMTFAQAFTMMKNTAIQSFRPIAEYLRSFLNSEQGKKLLEIGNELIVAVAYVVGAIVKFVTWGLGVIADHWEIVKGILIFGLILLAGIISYKLGAAIGSLIMSIGRFAILHPVLFGIIIVLLVIIGIIIAIWDTSKTVCENIANVCKILLMIILGVFAVILAVALATGVVIMSIPMIIMLVVVAVIAAILYVFLRYTEQVVGGVYWIGAVFQNVWTFIKNLSLGLWESIKAIATNIGIAFTNAWYKAKEAFWNFIASTLDGLNTLAKPLNKLLEALGLGTIDLSAEVGAAQSKANESSSKIRDYVDVGDAWSKGWNTYEYKNLGEAYDAGAAKGADIQDKINNFDLGSALEIDGLSKLNKGIPDFNSEKYALNASDPSDILGNTPNSALNDISDDTGKIADSMDIVDTELKYLKELGEREAINKFTTAEIKVEMKNDNYISERVDMDGVVDYLSDKLYEELGIVANGVHY